MAPYQLRAAKTSTVNKTSTIKVTISVEARELLYKHGMTIEGGILHKRAAKGGYDLAHGSGAVHIIIHPKDKDALAVALEDRGQRYAELEIGWHPLLLPSPVVMDRRAHDRHDVHKGAALGAEDGLMISPLNLSEDTVVKLFPDVPPPFDAKVPKR
jgi:hypothetical protein